MFTLTDRLYRARSLDDVFDAALDCIIRTQHCDRASILLFDDDGKMRFTAWRGLSDGYRTALDGHSPWTPGDVDPDPILVTDISMSDEPEHVVSVIRREGIVSLGFFPLTVNGQVVGKFMTYYDQPHAFDETEVWVATTISRQIGFSIDRSRTDASRKRALAELRLSEMRFRNMSENAPVMIWMSDANGACLHLNRMLREFWGVDEEAIKSFDWRPLIHPDDVDHVMSEMGAALTARSNVTVKGRYLNAKGDYRYLETHAQPRLSSDGEMLGMIGVNIDITDREQAEAQRELLFAELNHRVKNTLAVILAIAHRTFQNEADSEPVQMFQRRLRNLANAHDVLTREHWESTPLNRLAVSTLSGDGADLDRFRISGPHALLTPKQSLAISMALHELHTNALKHGAFSNADGLVHIEWEADTDSALARFVWQEKGGPAITPPKTRGFGLFLIEKVLAAEFEKDVILDFHPTGLRCCIETSADRRLQS